MEFCTWDQMTLSKSGKKLCSTLNSEIVSPISVVRSTFKQKQKTEMALEANYVCAQWTIPEIQTT